MYLYCFQTQVKRSEDLEEIQLNGLVMWKIRNSWQLVKHPWLYSDLLQDLKGETLIAVGSQQRTAQYPAAGRQGWWTVQLATGPVMTAMAGYTIHRGLDGLFV